MERLLALKFKKSILWNRWNVLTWEYIFPWKLSIIFSSEFLKKILKSRYFTRLSVIIALIVLIECVNRSNWSKKENFWASSFGCVKLGTRFFKIHKIRNFHRFFGLWYSSVKTFIDFVSFWNSLWEFYDLVINKGP